MPFQVRRSVNLESKFSVSFLFNFGIGSKVKLVSSNHQQLIQQHTYRIYSLGDTALTIELGNRVDEQLNDRVMDCWQYLQKNSFEGIKEIVPAYSSLTVYYDVWVIKKKFNPAGTVADWMKTKLEQLLQETIPGIAGKGRLIEIPVCYEKAFAANIETVAAYRNISTEEVIKIHSSKTYRVFMMGFLPGFAYMGQVDDVIAAPRKDQPAPVKAGSVGIAGNQTGVYPLDSPGGWQVIGQTPMKLFDAGKEDPCLLHTGDTVRFYAISQHEFENY